MSQLRPVLILGALAITAGIAAQFLLGAPSTDVPNIAEGLPKRGAPEGPALTTRKLSNKVDAIRTYPNRKPAPAGSPSPDAKTRQQIEAEVIRDLNAGSQMEPTLAFAKQTRTLLEGQMQGIRKVYDATPAWIQDAEDLMASFNDQVDGAIAQVEEGTLSAGSARKIIHAQHLQLREDLLGQSPDEAARRQLERLMPVPKPPGRINNGWGDAPKSNR